MKRGKLLPIIVAVLVVIVAITTFIKIRDSRKVFEKLTITYRDMKHEYTTVQVENVIVVSNISFWVVSTAKDSIVLNSSDGLYIDDEKNTEITIKLGKDTKACFEENDCIYFILE